MQVAASALHSLQAARPLPQHQASSACRHPTAPARLRRLPESPTDACVELLVAQEGAHPCCILPSSLSGQSKALQLLTGLEGLDERSLVNSLASVEGFVTNTCSECPTAGAAAGEEARRASPLAYSPPFSAFLERCLELAQSHLELGPAPAVLLLQIVSRLNYGADPALAETFYRRFYLPLRITLEAAVELHAQALTPQVSLAVFEAWAAMGATPFNSRAFGVTVREQIKTGLFTPQELCRLLSAKAAIRRAAPSYRPCQYDVCAACGGLLASNLQELSALHLTSVAAALGCFPWPVYQCVLPLLAAVAEEGVRRSALGEISPPAGSALVGAALASARALNPRLGAQLEAEVAGWRAQGRLATGHSIVSFAEGVGATACAR